MLDRARLAVLHSAGLLDAPAEAALDRLAALAARLLRAPLATVTLVDAERQVYAACVGLPEPLATARETPLDVSFCRFTVADAALAALPADGVLAIPDTRDDPRTRAMASVTVHGVHAYAGVPLVVDGQPVGTLCVMDTRSRDWTAEERALLADLGRSAATELELRGANRRLAAAHATSGALVAALRTRNAEAEATNLQLQAQAAELEASNAALQRQALELEAATEALQAAADLREQLLARAESLQALTAALSRAVTTADVVRAALREAGRGVGSLGGAFALLDAEATTFTLVAGPGITPEVEGTWVSRPSAGRLPGPEAVRTGRPVYSRTRAEYVARDAERLATVAEQLGIEAEATLPLVVGSRTLGVLTLLFAAPREFGPEDDAFLRTVADQCAQALERARLFEAEAAARRTADADRARLAGMYALSAALSAARTVGEVADAISDAGRAALGAEQSGVALLDADGATFRYRALRDVPDDIAAAWHAFPNTPATPYGVAAASRGVLVLPSQAEIVARFPGVASEITRQDLHTLVVLPLLRGAPAVGAGAGGDAVASHGAAAVLGAVHYGFVTPRRFERADEAAFAAVARECAEALERAHLLEAEREARARAEAADRARRDFLTTMSHELRTPLNAIQGHVQLLELELYGPVSGPQRDALQRVGRAQTHLLGLVNDVLNYARLEAGKVEFELRAVRAADVVRDVVPLIEPQRRARGLALTVSLPEDGDAGDGRDGGALRVWADPDKLAQVLLNLLSNAVKFTPAQQADGSPGRIAVELTAPAHEPTAAELRVRDTGIGIPAEKHGVIFEPFVQVRSDLTRPHEGTGLGLAISRDLARGMGGDVRVESEPGAGTTFIVRLRRVAAAAPEGGVVGASRGDGSGGGE